MKKLAFSHFSWRMLLNYKGGRYFLSMCNVLRNYNMFLTTFNAYLSQYPRQTLEIVPLHNSTQRVQLSANSIVYELKCLLRQRLNDCFYMFAMVNNFFHLEIRIIKSYALYYTFKNVCVVRTCVFYSIIYATWSLWFCTANIYSLSATNSGLN
jgi:hypothetical protein